MTDEQIATASPELFLRRAGRTVESGPIKGTGRTAEDLLEKDHAENVMIVDLVRNDLGRVSATGSVTMPALCKVEQHPGLVHLVSTGRGELAERAGWPELFAGTFPPGVRDGRPQVQRVACHRGTGDRAARPVRRTEASSGEGVAEWPAGWTVFCWARWISWTPFVGMFIARISRGRTIWQFVGGVILVPSAVSLLWFAIVGGSAMHLQDDKALGEAATAQIRLFDVLQQYPIATVSSIVVMILVAVFFVSGADAASIVMGTLSRRGCLAPTWAVVVFWGVLTGAVTAVMLLVGGGGGDALTGLQNLTILAAAHPGDGRLVYRAHPRSAPRPARHPRAEGQGGHLDGRHGRP